MSTLKLPSRITKLFVSSIGLNRFQILTFDRSGKDRGPCSYPVIERIYNLLLTADLKWRDLESDRMPFRISLKRALACVPMLQRVVLPFWVCFPRYPAARLGCSAALGSFSSRLPETRPESTLKRLAARPPKSIDLTPHPHHHHRIDPTARQSKAAARMGLQAGARRRLRAPQPASSALLLLLLLPSQAAAHGVGNRRALLNTFDPAALQVRVCVSLWVWVWVDVDF